MGTLAKRGIIRGRSVPVEGLLNDSKLCSERFTKSTLAAFGFSQILEKILTKTPFEVEEIELLLTKAPLSVLMKLSALASVDETPIFQIVPALHLPLESWMGLGGFSYVEKKIATIFSGKLYNGLNVFSDISDFSDLMGMWRDVIAKIKEEREDLVLVGPSVDQINSWLMLHESSSDRDLRSDRLKNVLLQLKQLQFDRLRETTYRSAIPILKECGFSVDLYTRLDRFRTIPLFARELHQLNKGVADGVIDSWCVGESFNASQKVAESVDYDLFIMRGLAVGSIVLQGLSERGISGSYPSLSSLGMFKFFGFNSKIYGAVDIESVEALHLPSYIDLLTVFGGDDRGILA